MSFSTAEQKVLTILWNKKMAEEEFNEIVGCTTKELGDRLNMARSNVSTLLNRLVRENKIRKTTTRPVIYYVDKKYETVKHKDQMFEDLIGAKGSLEKPIKLAKAAVLYPDNGLHTLLLGPTGVGKSMFAELMYKFSVESGMLTNHTPFVTLNCADYANNPQLLLSILFGHVKGAFTGADSNKDGLVDKANGGFLFLDEVHRLPPEGQELFFYLIDRKEYSPLGSEKKKHANLRLICATTESIESSLLQTFTRRIPMIISLPEIEKRPLVEKFELISSFFKEEAKKTSKSINVNEEAFYCLLAYNCLGNVGQMKSDIRQICATAFLDSVYEDQLGEFTVTVDHLPLHIRKAFLSSAHSRSELNTYAVGRHYFSTTGKQSTTLPVMNEHNYYQQIAEKIAALQKSELGDEEVKQLITAEIENQFSSYLNHFSNYQPELTKVVDAEIIQLVENFLFYCSKTFNEIYERNIFYGLCFHLQNSQTNGTRKETFSSQIVSIQKEHREVYQVVKNYFDTNEPDKYEEAEYAFITMFLVSNRQKHESKQDSIHVLIAMHGTATASSMAEVVNELLGIQSVIAYDLPLTKDQTVAYEEIKELITDRCPNKDILMLTDMGSLSLFGELIAQELNKQIRVVGMITTALALELTRKSQQVEVLEQLEPLINESYAAFLDYFRNKNAATLNNYEKIIVTLCMTGQGGAIQIKNVIEETIDLDHFHTTVVPLAMSDKELLLAEIRRIAKNKQLLAIVGTFDPEIIGIPFISFSELLNGKPLDLLMQSHKPVISFASGLPREIFERVLGEEQADQAAEVFQNFFTRVSQQLEITLDQDQAIGISVHMSSLIKDMQDKRARNKITIKSQLYDKMRTEFTIVQQLLQPVEEAFHVKIEKEEVLLLTQVLLGK